MSTSIVPRENDVLLGRGPSINAHPGNVRFRSMVEDMKPAFTLASTKRGEKRVLATKIIEDIQKLDPPGRFLTVNKNAEGDGNGGSDATGAGGSIHPTILKKSWALVDYERVVTKVLHRLREGDQAEKDAKKKEKMRSMKLKSQPQPSVVASSDYITKQQMGRKVDGQVASMDHLHINDSESLGNNPQFNGADKSMNKEVNAGNIADGLDGQGHGEEDQDFNVDNWDDFMLTLDVLDTNEDEVVDEPFEVVSSSMTEPDPLLEALSSSINSGHAQQPPGQMAHPSDVGDVPSAAPQGGQLDTELDSFLRDFSTQHDGNNIHVHSSMQWTPPQHLQEPTTQIALRSWIQMTRNDLNCGRQAMISGRNDGIMKYIERSLPIALKLTECLVEGATEEGRVLQPIPLASIAVEDTSISIRLKANLGSQSLHNGLEMNFRGGQQCEVIDSVNIMSKFNDNPDPGSKLSRLFALGRVLHELFSGEEQLLSPDVPVSLDSIDFGNALPVNSTDGGQGPRKKKQSSHHSKDRLESLGMPYSICVLIRSLLECGQGDFCGDGAYTSFQDVQLDLQLMMNDPARFVKNIETNPLPQLVICNKHYGREKEVQMLEVAYQQQRNGSCSGVIISGEAGVGKSKLAMHVRHLTEQANGSFLNAKFDQNKDVYPLSTIVSLFGCLCDVLVQGASPSQLKEVDQALQSSLGKQASFLSGVLPSLSKIMSSCVALSPSTGDEGCVDMLMSLRFLFSELLCVISSHSSKSIAIFLDDLQWCDQTSLLIIESLLSVGNVFFVFCYRGDEVQDNGPFREWLNSISGFSLGLVKLKSVNVDAVNHLVSDSLHLSPRITRPLASVLHQKTRGNPLFLRQLLESLKEQGHIYVDLSHPRWAWQLSKIWDMEIADNVLALLTKDMRRLPNDLQLGLKVTSCLGSSINQRTIEILSQDLGMDLRAILDQLVAKAYMESIDNGMKTGFVHDKIQQAAYEMMTEGTRCENHMRYGLALCASSVTASVEDEDWLFFLAVNQINKGGPGVLSDPTQRSTIAALNLKAGRRAIALSDFTAAFSLFKHGISFLDQSNHWESQYDLSVELFDAVAESACVINDTSSVKNFTEQLEANARRFEDKLNCLYAAVVALRHADLQKESMQATVKILKELGEPDLRPMAELKSEISAIDGIFQNTSDDSILSIPKNGDKKYDTTMKLYSNLIHVLHFVESSFMGSACLRMVQLTLKNGLCSMSPLAFCYFGEALAATGNFHLACRLGRIALQLVERKESSMFKATVITFSYQFVLWSSVPLEAVSDAHHEGYKAGMLSGDVLYAGMNNYFSILTSFLAGNSLSEVRKRAQDFAIGYLAQNTAHVNMPLLLHIHITALIEGLPILEMEQIHGAPGLKETLAQAMNRGDKAALLGNGILSLVRSYLFDQLDEASLEVNVSDIILATKTPIRPMVCYAFFYEGLVAFRFARQSTNRAKWMSKGEFLLGKMQGWSELCPWNFENKAFLLLAEKMFASGDYEQAESFYKKSILSAREHRFLHEEALASECAAVFLYAIDNNTHSCAFYRHSIKCYQKWGAVAVARRVESTVQSKFGPNGALLMSAADGIVDTALAPYGTSTTKKRQAV